MKVDTFKEVEVLKHFSYQALIMSPMLKIAAFRGKDIITNIFDALSKREDGTLLMPEDYRTLYEGFAGPSEKKRTICDFIAGMTDDYAIRYYSRLVSPSNERDFIHSLL